METQVGSVATSSIRVAPGAAGAAGFATDFAGAGFSVTTGAATGGAETVAGVLRTGSEAEAPPGFELVGQNSMPSRITTAPKPTVITIGDRHQSKDGCSWNGAAVATGWSPLSGDGDDARASSCFAFVSLGDSREGSGFDSFSDKAGASAGA